MNIIGQQVKIHRMVVNAKLNMNLTTHPLIEVTAIRCVPDSEWDWEIDGKILGTQQEIKGIPINAIVGWRLLPDIEGKATVTIDFQVMAQQGRLVGVDPAKDKEQKK